MPVMLHVSKAAVRRFLLERQGFRETERNRRAKPDEVLRTVRALECVQLDPVAAVERNQHLVLSARISGYEPAALEQLLGEGRVFEYWANAMCAIPIEDYPLFEPTRRRMRERLQPELDRLGSVVDDVLKRLEMEGPLPSKAFQSAQRVRGYWDNENAKTKATSHALNLLNDMGTLQVVRREGTTRYFDLTERAVPKELLEQAKEIDETAAREALLCKYMRAYRVFDTADSRFGWTRMTAEERRQYVGRCVDKGLVVPLHIEDVKRPYFILAEDVDQLTEQVSSESEPAPAYPDSIRFLPPLDNLLWRRERVEDLFGFSYTWEVYTPAEKRRYGYYAMPIMWGDKFIGRMDPRLNREHSRLDIHLLQIEPRIRWTKTLRHRLFRALDRFAAFHQASLGNVERTEPADLKV